MKKIIYWIATGILTLIFGFSAFNYFFNYDMVSGFFVDLGFPTWLIYPMAIAKVAGVAVVWLKVPTTIKEWAYAGFFFNAILALTAHLMVADGMWQGALLALLAVITSRIYMPTSTNS